MKDLWPAAVVDDLVGAVLFPTDGTVNPGDATMAFAKGAVDRGARVRARDRGDGVPLRRARARDRARHLRRGDRGRDGRARGGLWTSELARSAGASVALYPAEHVWVMTEEAQGAREDSPFLRDLDAYLYIRHYRGSVRDRRVRAERQADAPGRSRPPASPSSDPTGIIFAPVLAGARERVPEIETIGFSHYLRAPESFTPDSNFQLGYVPEVPGLFVAAGFNSQGIIFGPGAGKAAAEWIVAGHPTMDLVEVDVARTGRWANQRAWLHERTVESLGGLYEMHWPQKQPRTGRGVRRVPLYGAFRDAGAAFGQAAGWERANWFEPGVVEPVVRLLLRGAVVVPGRARRGARHARGRGVVRPVDLLEVPRAGTRRPLGLERGWPRRSSMCPSVASSTRCSATPAGASRWTRP